MVPNEQKVWTDGMDGRNGLTDGRMDHGRCQNYIPPTSSRDNKELPALRGKFGPVWSEKLKVALHQFHPIGLLKEWSKCKILAFILLLPLLW